MSMIKGQGKITIGGLHQRLTRFQFGKFVLGGGILHDHKRIHIQSKKKYTFASSEFAVSFLLPDKNLFYTRRQTK